MCDACDCCRCECDDCAEFDADELGLDPEEDDEQPARKRSRLDDRTYPGEIMED